MSFGRERRLLLGWAAFLAPLPLPFNNVLEWPVLLLYLLLTALFLNRAQDPAARWLPPWVMNALALAYLPVLLVDFRFVGLRGQVVQTMVHVCMFAVVVKLFALRKPGEASTTFGAIFFLFLASMGTSVHPSVVVYLLTFVVLSLVILVRFSQFGVLATFGQEVLPAACRMPLVRFVTYAISGAVVLAALLFPLFPRFNTPFVGVRGVGTGTLISAAGFTDEVTLDSIGGQRDNPEVALRLRPVGSSRALEELRLKGGTYEIYRDRRWNPSGLTNQALVSHAGEVLLETRRPEALIDLWLQPLRSRALLLPVEAVRFELDFFGLRRDRGGAVSMWRPPGAVLSYRVGVAGEPRLLAEKPRLEDSLEPTLDLSGVTPPIAELARQVAGDGTPAERAARLERHLTQSYAYSLDYVGRPGPRPLEDFLFELRAGHCELFASAMVLMLRSEGIPARLVTGFLGAEYSPLTDYYVVRQSNAHAWVEAYFEGDGWKLYDPTPPAGRPTVNRQSSWSLFQQAWDYLEFRWDRYVLTYGFLDQIALLGSLRDAWDSLADWFRGDEESPELPSEATPAASAAQPEAEVSAAGPSPFASRLAWSIFLAAAFTAAVLLRLRWRRGHLTATVAFRQLRRLLKRSGVPVADSTPPAALGRRAGERFPRAGESAGKVIDFYLRESFGGRDLDQAEREELGEALRETRRAVAGK